MKRARISGVVAAAVAALLAARVGAVPPATADERAIAHVLNRIGYGPRPGDIEKVRHVGLPQYVEAQLHPERIPDQALAARLSGLETLTLSSRQLAERYELPALNAKRNRKRQAANDPNPDAGQQRAKAMDPLRQEANRPLLELSEQKILRAAYSDRQLEEVLTDFWFNHFNVDARKGPDRYLLTEYEREAIRPHVLGRFRDLLGATAKSPAMLFYLDNWMSADPNGPHMDNTRRRPGGAGLRLGGGLGGGQMPGGLQRPPNMAAQRKNAPKGLNENYGRELLELHTLGVDGGYTQRDVTEVARAFTGWSIANPRLGGAFRFTLQLHDTGDKVVLGHPIAAGGGERDGEEVLDILAADPSTARFIATKLARRFVSDTPPQALVDRAAATFRETHGDLRAVMTVLLTSPEFLSPDAYRAKVKSPFEFIVSAVRVTGAEVADARPLVRALQELGMPLYQCQPPTGYKDTAETWVNTGALVNRMNVALTLANGSMRGVDLGRDVAPASLVAGGLSDATLATIAKASSRPQAIALALGSPEFQRR